MKKLGFFGGSFNPPTYAHINIAKMSIEKFNLDAVYFVPVGNLYNKPSLIDEKYRYKMLQLVCGDKIKAENVELNRKETLDTLQAFNLIEEKYKNDATEIFYIMGADNFEKLPNWKDSKKLVEDYQYIIFKRDGSNLEQCIEKNQILKKNRQNFKFLDLQQYADISSGIIRELIKKEDYEKCKEYTDAAIVQYIKENKLYL
jgi:nicotinate-nucleotide adenylyltransferase